MEVIKVGAGSVSNLAHWHNRNHTVRARPPARSALLEAAAVQPHACMCGTLDVA